MSIEDALTELAEQIDTDTTHELLEVFRRNSSRQLGVFQDAYSRGDFDLLKREAHSLKSASANLGALELADVCLSIEKTAGPDEATQAAVTKAKHLHSEALKTIRLWQDNNPA